MQNAVVTIPEFDFRWGVPALPSTLRSDEFKRSVLEEARTSIRELTGVDFINAPFTQAVAAVGKLEGDEQFPTAVLWLLCLRHFNVAAQAIEIQRELPLWFWEAVLEHVDGSSRFNALTYVSAPSFEVAIERWANKPEGVSLAAINYWRKKRTDEWGMVPEHTFYALYGS